VPAPLAALLLAVAIVTAAWALFVPPFQVPDEGAHIAYVQSIAENFRRPTPPPGLPLLMSTEARRAARAAQTAGSVARPEGRALWSAAVAGRWSADERRLPASARKDPAADGVDPPLYYLLEAVPYRLAYGGSFFDRLFAMRLWSGLFVLVTTIAAWLLAGEVFGPAPVLQLVAAGCVGLQPMATFISGGVNPDGAWFALGALILWLGVRTIRRGTTRRRAAALVAAALAAGLVKTAALGALPAVVLALTLGASRDGSLRGALTLRRAAIAIVAGVLVVGAGLLAARSIGNRIALDGNPKGFVSYLWQFYLPRPSFLTPLPAMPTTRVYDVWIQSAWAAFGWLELRFPSAVYVALTGVSIATFAGAAAALLRRRVRIDGAVLAFFALAVGGLVLGLHLAEYKSLADRGQPLIQGRYFLPLVLPIAGVAVAAAITNLRPARRVVGVAAVLGAMFVLQLFSLGLLVGRFYV
jgi:hypothetical protein